MKSLAQSVILSISFCVLLGMSGTAAIIFVEDDSERVESFLVQFGYSKEKLTGSPNVIYSANYRKIS
jgi:hypothetical protein